MRLEDKIIRNIFNKNCTLSYKQKHNNTKWDIKQKIDKSKIIFVARWKGTQPYRHRFQLVLIDECDIITLKTTKGLWGEVEFNRMIPKHI